MSDEDRRNARLARVFGLQFGSYEPSETDGAPELEAPTPEPPRPKWRRHVVIQTATSRRFVPIEE